MSALWAVADLVKATGGVPAFGDGVGEWCGWRVEIDSRKIQAGDIFVALHGERFDGHEYVAEAFKRGAIAAIVERKLDIAGNQLVVGNCYKALNDLAIYNRARSSAKIIGVTGSVGKTTTKEMLKLALSVHGKTYATSGNYNNHIGTPLNLANLPLDTQFAVFEMGMNHAGEIAHLSKMVRPHIALITGVEAVHLQYFSSIEEIATAKAEILEGVEAGGIAIMNADQLYFQDPAQQLRCSQDLKKVTFGANEKADARLLSYKANVTGCEISASLRGGKASVVIQKSQNVENIGLLRSEARNDEDMRINYNIAATGRHLAIISLSVLAVVNQLGLNVRESAQELAKFSDVEGRGRVEKITVNGTNILLINDSYNASPASMKAAFEKTSEVWQAYGGTGRKIALLGDMLELGETSPILHAQLAENLQATRFDKVYMAGNLMKGLYDALPVNLRAGHVENSVALLPMLIGAFNAGDVVLIKGSHGSKMYEVAQALLEKKEIKNAV